jgi:putative hemolysin
MSAVVPAPRSAEAPAAAVRPPAARTTVTAAATPMAARASAGDSAERRYRVSLARDQADVRAAQRLRHRVFAGELGARLDGPEPGLDSDSFDAHCDHLLVREEATAEVVGTYRLLPPDRARAAGGLQAPKGRGGRRDARAAAARRPSIL